MYNVTDIIHTRIATTTTKLAIINQGIAQKCRVAAAWQFSVLFFLFYFPLDSHSSLLYTIYVYNAQSYIYYLLTSLCVVYCHDGIAISIISNVDTFFGRSSLSSSLSISVCINRARTHTEAHTGTHYLTGETSSNSISLSPSTSLVQSILCPFLRSF